MGHAEEILTIVETEGRRLGAITASTAAVRSAPGKWSRKEVLGHVVDSALNNHQRFVRAQFTEALEFPGYTQVDWVRCQDYQSADWPQLVVLWTAVNRHLAHVVSRIPPEKLAVPCRIGGGKPVALGDLVADYLRHLRHHLARV